MNKRIYEIINEVKVDYKLKVIDMEEALRLKMRLESWNIFMYAEHMGETYLFSFHPTSVSDIDEDVTNLHEEWHWMVDNHHKLKKGEEE